MKRIRSLAFPAGFLFLVGFSLPSAEMVQPRRLIDAHTAGILPRGYFDLETRIYASGDSTIQGSGLLMAIAVGITDRLNVGLSYGGDGLIGRGRATPNPYPGALIKYRLFEENFILPALAIGYDHQGFGGIEYEDTYGGQKGFVYKSQGFFAALSKNYLLFSKVQFGLHGGINFSLEEIRRVRWPNGYIGLDLGLNEELALAVEYDLALNSRDPLDKESYLNPLYGYLNAGIRWAFSESFYLEFDAKNITRSKVQTDDDGRWVRLPWGREMKLVYLTSF